MSNNIDAILKATEGHTPGEWSGRLGPRGSNQWRELGPLDTVECDGLTLITTPSLADADLVLCAPALRAEVVRLRERDAAWEWLAVCANSHGFRIERCGDGRMLAISIYCEVVASAPDPVALATALDANWRKA